MSDAPKKPVWPWLLLGLALLAVACFVWSMIEVYRSIEVDEYGNLRATTTVN